MGDKELFTNLASDLSERERKRLLERLKDRGTGAAVSGGEVPAEDDGAKKKTSAVRRELGFLEKLMVFFKSLFSSQTKKQVEEQFFLARLVRDLDRQYGRVFSLERGDFFVPFSEEMLRLAGLWSPFRETVQSVSGSKAEFVNFLFETELPGVYRRLSEEISPQAIEKELDIRDIPDIRRTQENRKDRILNNIPPREKEKLGGLVKYYYSLEAFLKFPFEEIGRTFLSPAGMPRICPADEARPVLLSFWEAARGFQPSGEGKVISAVYTFEGRRAVWGGRENSEAGLEAFRERYRQAAAALRNFKSTYDMDRITKALEGDLDYTPRKPRLGGEEWFSLLKRCWGERCQKELNQYKKERQSRELLERAKKLFGRTECPGLGSYNRSSLGAEDLPYQLAASLLTEFMEHCFLPKMNPILKLLQTDASFYKEQNKAEYDQAYGRLFKMTARIQEFDRSFAEGGENHQRLKDYLELNGNSCDSSEVRDFLAQGGKKLHSFIFEFLASLDLLRNLLDGILFGRSGERYDSIANLKAIGGANNEKVIASLETVNSDLQKVSEFLHEAADLENRQGI